MASSQGCELRYRWRHKEGYHVTADGPLVDLQVLGERVWREFVSYANGYLSALRTRNKTRLIGRICGAYLEALTNFSTGLTDLVDQMNESGLKMVPSSFYFDPGNASHLSGVAKSLARALLLYYQSEMRPTQATEEAHTAVGLFLIEALGEKPGSKTFRQLVAMARDRGIIDAKAAGAFKQLNEHRKKVKHHGQGVKHETLAALLPTVVAGCQQLIQAIRMRRRSN